MRRLRVSRKDKEITRLREERDKALSAAAIWKQAAHEVANLLEKEQQDRVAAEKKLRVYQQDSVLRYYMGSNYSTTTGSPVVINWQKRKNGLD